MTTVGFIGSGRIGTVLAKLSVAAGYDVLDTGNYSPARRDGQIPGLDDGALTSSELLQRQVPDAKVVKVFNNIYFRHLEHLARPEGAADVIRAALAAA
jgi:predicted dinucleotide-binding enzyme